MNSKTSILATVLIASTAVMGSAAIGTAVALSGVISQPQVTDPLSSTSIDARSADAYDCVNGAVIANLAAGQRVLIVSRSFDGDWVGVRNPSATAQTVWLPLPALTLDESEQISDDLPVSGDCPTTSVTVDAVDPNEAAPPTETPDTPAAVDTTAPVLSAFAAGPAQVSCMTGTPWPTNSQLSLTATDASGVTNVELTWSGSYSGSAAMQGSGSTWSYTFDATGPGDKGTVVFSAVATDTRGNRSAPATVSIDVDCLV